MLIRHAERSEDPPLSAAVWRGTPPLRLARGDDITPPFLWSIAVFTAVLLLYGTDDLSSGREPRLLRSHRGLRYADVFLLPPARHIAPVAWIQDVEATLYVYVFAPNTSQPRRKHRPCPGGLAMVIRQVLTHSGLGWLLRPTRLVPALRCPFFHLSKSTWPSLKPWMVGSLLLPNSSPQLTAAAGNYAYVILRIWVGQTSPWHSADILIPARVSLSAICSFTLTLLHLFTLGTLAPLGQASNFLFFSARIADGRHSLSYAAACLTVDVCRHTPPACR